MRARPPPTAPPAARQQRREADRVSFSKVISLGNMVSVAGMLGVVCATVGGAYLALTSSQANLAGDIRLGNQRADTIEHNVGDLRESQRQFAGEMRGALDKISQQISDLRTDVAKRR